MKIPGRKIQKLNKISNPGDKNPETKKIPNAGDENPESRDKNPETEKIPNLGDLLKNPDSQEIVKTQNFLYIFSGFPNPNPDPRDSGFWTRAF